MKSETQVTYEPNIKLNSSGEPDVDYYISEGKRMRAQALREMLSGTVEGVKYLFEKAHLFPLHFSSTVHH